MKRQISLHWVILLCLVTALSVVPNHSIAAAQTSSSSGCAGFNGLTGTFVPGESHMFTGDFLADEVVNIVFTLGTGTTVGVVGLLVNGVWYGAQYQSAPITISYTVPADGTYAFHWGSHGGYSNGPVNYAVNCGAEGVPGCDALINIPAQAVMGKFVAPAAVYSVPGQMIEPTLTIEAGKTYLVIGQDASGEYRQILLQCTFVWVPANSVGPNPDAVWNSRPLPTTVVK